jgi:hypothetical protein
MFPFSNSTIQLGLVKKLDPLMDVMPPELSPKGADPVARQRATPGLVPPFMP